MRRLLLGCLAAMWLVTTAHAQPATSRLVLNRVDLEPTPIPGISRLRLLVSNYDTTRSAAPLALGGDKTWKLRVSGGDRRLPYIAGRFNGTDLPLAVVVLIETTPDFQAELPAIKAALDAKVLAALPPTAQVAIVGFTDKQTSGKLLPVKQAQGKLAELNASADDVLPKLPDAVNKAIGILRTAKSDPEGAPVRKVIVLIGDGRDEAENRQAITDLGKKARKAGIPIDTIGFIPNLKPTAGKPAGSKGTLLHLGELARQSQGAFRYVEFGGEQGWNTAFTKLGEELADQYVITYLLPTEEIAGKRIGIATDKPALTSNELKSPGQPMCGGQECTTGYCATNRCIQPREETSRGIFGWVLILGGIGVGAVAVLVVVGAVLAKRGKKKPPAGFEAFAAGADSVIAQAGAAPPTAGMPAVGAPPPAAPPAAPAPIYGPQLYLMSGPRTGQRVALRHGFTIGKAPGSDLLLDEDGFASSNHAQILMDAAGNCTLVDRGSTNGTFVNGVRVSEYPLTHGVAIRVGSTDVRFLAQ